MKKLLFVLITFLFTFLNSSCLKTILCKNKILDIKSEIDKVDFPSKEVLFIGMHHFGKQEFYDDVKTKIDSFKKIGFFIFVEGIKINDSVELKLTSSDTVDIKKIRKIMGVNNYSFTTNKFLDDIKVKYKLVGQNNFELYKSLNENEFKVVDLYNKDLVNAYESSKGKIELSRCDSITPLGASYNCSKVSKKDIKYLQKEIFLKIRNENIILELEKSTYNKILIIYGKEHLEGIQKLLVK